MIKKLLPLLIIISLFVGYPMSSFAAVSSTGKTSVSVKKPAVKKVVKKKKKKVAERLIINPPLITLDNAPHSAKKVIAKKKTAKKPVVAIRKN